MTKNEILEEFNKECKRYFLATMSYRCFVIIALRALYLKEHGIKPEDIYFDARSCSLGKPLK